MEDQIVDIKQEHINGLKNYSLRVSRVENPQDFGYLLNQAEDYMAPEDVDELIEALKYSFINHLTRQIQIYNENKY